MKIVESGYQPDLLVALWRGGTPIGIAMQEVFEYLGMPCQHFAIRSSSYEGLDQQGAIRLWGMELLQPSSQHLFSLGTENGSICRWSDGFVVCFGGHYTRDICAVLRIVDIMHAYPVKTHQNVLFLHRKA
jgi:hypothetical protein